MPSAVIGRRKRIGCMAAFEQSGGGTEGPPAARGGRTPRIIASCRACRKSECRPALTQGRSWASEEGLGTVPQCQCARLSPVGRVVDASQVIDTQDTCVVFISTVPRCHRILFPPVVVLTLRSPSSKDTRRQIETVTRSHRLVPPL